MVLRVLVLVLVLAFVSVSEIEEHLCMYLVQGRTLRRTMQFRLQGLSGGASCESQH